MATMFGIQTLNYFINPIKQSSNSVIIEIYPESTQEKTEQKTALVTSLLQQNNFIQQFSVVDKEEIKSIFNTFSGDYKDSKYTIPLPVIINVAFNNNINFTEEVQNLRLNLSQKANNVYVDSQNDLLSRLIKPVTTTQYAFASIPFVAFALLIILMVIVMHAVVFSNKSTLKILLLLGITNNGLALEFATWAFIKTFVATAISFVLATTIISILLLFNANYYVVFICVLYFLGMLVIIPIINFIISFLVAKKLITLIN